MAALIPTPAAVLPEGSRVVLVVLSPTDSSATVAATTHRCRSIGAVLFFAHVAPRASWWGGHTASQSFSTHAAAEELAAGPGGGAPVHFGQSSTFVSSLAYAVLERGPIAVVLPACSSARTGLWRTTGAESLVGVMHRLAFEVACVVPTAAPSSDPQPATAASRSLHIVALSPSNVVNTSTRPDAARTVRFVQATAEDGALVVLVAAFAAFVSPDGWALDTPSEVSSDTVRTVSAFTQQWLGAHAKRLSLARPGLRVVCDAAADASPVAAVEGVIARRRLGDGPVTVVVGYGAAPWFPRWVGNVAAYVRRSSRDSLIAALAGTYTVIVA